MLWVQSIAIREVGFQYPAVISCPLYIEDADIASL
jgi:hypothetical protein